MSDNIPTTALKRTTLHDTHKQLGAKMVPFGGYDMPVWYSSVLEEHNAVRTAAGLFDVTHMGVWDAKGPNAALFLDALTTNDVFDIKVGGSQYGYLLDEAGHTLDDIMIYRVEAERYLIVVNASNNDADWAWTQTQAYSPAFKLPHYTLRDLRADSSGAARLVDVALQGPASLQVLLGLIDDGSTDTETINILKELEKKESTITVLNNKGKKGAAGARNTGIIAARGEWITFLDSDDIWLPHSLALRWSVMQQYADARWIAARFLILRPTAQSDGSISFQSADELTAQFSRPLNEPKILKKEHPVLDFSRECFTGIMTVLIKKELIVDRGMFDERLSRAEDYKLWFLCAFDQDLYFLDAETAYYRIHPQSLTHGERPRLLYEDKMVELLLHEPAARAHRPLLMKRLDIVMQEHCYFYRSHKSFALALVMAAKWILKRPHRVAAWKELLAASLRVA